MKVHALVGSIDRINSNLLLHFEGMVHYQKLLLASKVILDLENLPAAYSTIEIRELTVLLFGAFFSSEGSFLLRLLKIVYNRNLLRNLGPNLCSF